MIDACGCCEAPVPPTPEQIENRPGLSAIAYRVGTFASFRQAMIEAIARAPGLRGWTARRSDDYGIALLEMWAYLADILTFYQERMANEAFLRTARQRDSILRLAALLDYRLRPGVAATTCLAFTVEASAEASAEAKSATVDIPVGLRAQSVPGQEQKPEKFETVEAITAYARLNRVRIYPQPQPENPLRQGSTGGTLTSDPAGLAPGDKLVIFTEGEVVYPVGHPAVEEKQIEAVKQKDGQTLIRWSPPMVVDRGGEARVWRFQRKAHLFGATAPASFLKPGLPAGEAESTEILWRSVTTSFATYKYGGGPKTVRRADALGENALDLDGSYEDLKPGADLLVVIGPPLMSYTEGEHVAAISIRQQTSVTLHRVKSVQQINAAWGILTGVATRVVLDTRILPGEDFDIRNATVYLLGPELRLWNRQYPDTISGDTAYVPIDQLHIERDRTILIDDGTGEPAVATVTQATQVDTDGDGQADHLAIEFTPALPRPFNSRTAVLYGNVAKATHGETVKDEVLGSGEASKTLQSFPLKKKPVTFVPSPGAPNGAANTLQVTLDRVRWRQVPSLYGQGPAERVYTTRLADDGTLTVQFGDGISGARLPSGRNNAVAVYRQGIGRDGNVDAGKLTMLLDRPVGLKAVTNPQAAAGGTDAEDLDDARANAPTTVRTFDRAVSLRDFEDLARSFAGVAKARATWVWNGEEQVVHLTVAGVDGAPITDAVRDSLVAYLNLRRDPNRLLRVASPPGYTRVSLRVSATIGVDPAYVASEVKARAEAAVLAFFAFDKLNFGQSIHLSDLYAVLQGVEGVVYVDVDTFQYRDRVGVPAIQPHIAIRLARPEAGTIVPAELATLDAADLTITPMGGLPG